MKAMDSRAEESCAGLRHIVLFALSIQIPMLSWADKEIVDGIEWTYTIKDGKARIGKGPSPKATGSARIPSVLSGCPVTSIGNSAFGAALCGRSSRLSSVIIPDSVTDIESYPPRGVGGAFFGCTDLESMIIPASVTNIGRNAFSECGGLQSVIISNGVKSMGDSAFSGCKNLKSTVIPPSVISIGVDAFSLCNGLKSVIISDGVESIGDYSFCE